MQQKFHTSLMQTPDSVAVSMRVSVSAMTVFWCALLLFLFLIGLAVCFLRWFPRHSHPPCESPSETPAPSDSDDKDMAGVSTEELFTSTVRLVERATYDDQAVVQFIEDNFGPWSLMFKIISLLVRFWGVLAIMYWSLMHGSNGALMDCNDPGHTQFVRHACKYTVGCLYAYPILCANMTLVLMVRVLVQMQFYYSMLKQGCVVNFVTIHIMWTPWPWICVLSMLQGGLHFVLKTYHEHLNLFDLNTLQTCAHASSKFVIPGLLFMSFFPAYADIDRLLVTLNCIAEQDYTRNNRKCPWLADVEILNERVLCRDVRNNDVHRRTRRKAGKESATIGEVVRNLKENYEVMHETWVKTWRLKSQSREQKEWVFRAMWPAAVLTNKRMDVQDPETWQWVCVIALMLTCSSLVSLMSLVVLLLCCESSGSLLSEVLWRTLRTGGLKAIPTDAILGNAVLISHCLIVCFFLYRSIWGMFYQTLRKKSPDIPAFVLFVVLLFVLGCVEKTMLDTVG
jgi:hypothetical protein